MLLLITQMMSAVFHRRDWVQLCQGQRSLLESWRASFIESWRSLLALRCLVDWWGVRCDIWLQPGHQHVKYLFVLHIFQAHWGWWFVVNQYIVVILRMVDFFKPGGQSQLLLHELSVTFAESNYSWRLVGIYIRKYRGWGRWTRFEHRCAENWGVHLGLC